MGMKLAKITLICSLMLVCPATAFPQRATGNPENWCRNGAFPSDGTDFKVAKVIGGGRARVHFLKDDGDCPQSGEAKCQAKSYLIPGDEVLVSRTFGSWVCSWYQPRRDEETVGWLPAGNLSIAPSTAIPSLEQWVGRWKYGPQSLNIRREGHTHRLKVAGQAYWYGLGDNVHEGSFEAGAEPRGNALVLDDGDCKVLLKLVEDYLIATDNSECGGMNVRFDGVYRKR
jgi:hypothetical protein